MLSFGAAGDRFVRIASLDFFGQYRRSPMAAGCSPGATAMTRARMADIAAAGRGASICLRRPARSAGRADRPNDGQVADNGSFVINDWLFGDGLKGVFRAYRADGTLLVKRSFTANLLNNGIADDGSMAVCQTCNAPGPDGSVLAIFDLESGREVADWVPESGWAGSYAFPEAGIIRLRYHDGQAYDYAIDGQFLDRDRWLDAQARSDNVHVLHNRCADRPSPDDERQDHRIRQCDPRRPGVRPRRAPLALKVRGLCQEALGNLASALSDYEEAIALDPKIGLKRKVAEIRKRLA
jgi:hypothetical protein